MRISSDQFGEGSLHTDDSDLFWIRLAEGGGSCTCQKYRNNGCQHSRFANAAVHGSNELFEGGTSASLRQQNTVIEGASQTACCLAVSWQNKH